LWDYKPVSGEVNGILSFAEARTEIVDLNELINLNFIDGTIVRAILDGSKKIETRAMNPEEKDRYF
jgi:leucyl aminopeptidase (aminopeptidase T)